MDWLQVLTISGSTIGACWLMHRESLAWWREGQKEMKDFHGRMCTLEEKYIQMMKGQEEIRTLLLQKALAARE